MNIIGPLSLAIKRARWQFLDQKNDSLSMQMFEGREVRHE